MKNVSVLATSIGLALIGLGAAATAQAATYVVTTHGSGLGKTQLERIRAAGGTVTAQLPQVGLAIVEGGEGFDSAAGAIPGIQSVTRDVQLQWHVPEPEVAPITAEAFMNPPFSGDDDRFFDLQWGHAAVDAAGAWNAGFRGEGATVAVLDSGIYCSHADIAPNLVGGASFVPGESFCNTAGSSHGTHVAGTILASDNAVGTIGVAPESKLLGVKVLSASTGSGSFAGIIQGIVWAVDNGANVINMSLGVQGGLPRGGPGANEVAELVNATKRAIQYANANEVLVVASSGNDARDLDKDADVISFPGQLHRRWHPKAGRWIRKPTWTCRPATATTASRRSTSAHPVATAATRATKRARSDPSCRRAGCSTWSSAPCRPATGPASTAGMPAPAWPRRTSRAWPRWSTASTRASRPRRSSRSCVGRRTMSASRARTMPLDRAA